MTRTILGILISSCLLTTQSYADHPGEGSVTLEDLSREAAANNLEISQASSRLKGAQFSRKSAFGSFLPELSLEGGPLRTKFDEERHSGTAAYGKAEWNLYRGGIDSAKRSNAELEEEYSERQLEITKARVLREVAAAYYELLFLYESLALNEKALSLNAEQAKLARVKRASGYTSEADVIEFELREATLRSDLKQLLQERDERSLELSILLGRKSNLSLIAVKGHLVRESRTPKEDAVLKSLATNNPAVQEASLALQQRQNDSTMARAGFLPSLNLEAKYGRLANEEKVFRKDNSYSFYLTFKLPLFSGLSTYNDYQSSLSAIAESDIQLQRNQVAASASVSKLFSRLKSVRERLDLEEKTLARSEEYYKITVGEYRRGVKNSPDMVGATERLFDARLRNLRYRKEFYLSKLELEALAGSSPNASALY